MSQNKIDYEEIEAQLALPKGDLGLEIANKMNTTNSGMILNAFEHCNINKNEFVLELGYASAQHLKQVIPINKPFHYFGIETSEDMLEIAIKEFQEFQCCTFGQYDGITIPSKSNYFNKIVSTNTIYFWKNPIAFLNEIYRVLVPSGVLILGITSKDFMQKLPFVKNKFQLYGKNEISNLIEKSQFNQYKSQEYTETIVSNDGEKRKRTYSIVKLYK